jgi:hypothetical protein
MKQEDFDKLVDTIFSDLKTILSSKAKQYAGDQDRLDQFKRATVFTNLPAHRNLAGLMVKHTTSVYDMLQALNLTDYPISLWEEKIYDHINYLLLLMGLIEDAYKDRVICIAEKDIEISEKAKR